MCPKDDQVKPKSKLHSYVLIIAKNKLERAVALSYDSEQVKSDLEIMKNK